MVSVVAYNPATRGFTAEKPRAGTAEPELSIEALRLRGRQQELLADFGVLALKGTPFRQLLHEAARVVADGLTAEFAKVLKYLPEENKFLEPGTYLITSFWRMILIERARLRNFPQT